MNTMHALRFAVLALLALLLATGCGPARWAVRTTEPCPSPVGAPAADRERAYLAALLAVDDLHYEVVQREAPSTIEAVARNRHYDFETTWIIRVREDGSLSIDQPETARETHDFTDRWYRNLVRTFESYRCRDLDWLRWNAEGRGLVAVGGAGMIDAEDAAGGEAPAAEPPVAE